MGPLGSVRLFGWLKFPVISAVKRLPDCSATCAATLYNSMVGVQYTSENRGSAEGSGRDNIQKTTGLKRSDREKLGQVTTSTPYCVAAIVWTGIETLHPSEVPARVNPVPLEKGVKLP